MRTWRPGADELQPDARGAIAVKQLRDYRRNRFVIGTMAVLPVVFLILPMISLFKANVAAAASSPSSRRRWPPSFRRSSSRIWSLASFLAAATVFAHPMIVSAIYVGTHVVIQLRFTPLLAGRGVWIGIAVSARSTDVRAAQQLGVLGSLPLLAILALISLDVITVSAGLAIALAAALLAVDLLAWRVVAAMSDRERLITGTRT